MVAMIDDVEKIRHYLASEPLGSIQDVVISHIERSASIDLPTILAALARSRDADAIANVISALSFQRHRSDFLQGLVKSLAEGELWDDQDIARLQAILALPRLCPGDDSVRQILGKAYQSENIVVRDAALVAAQSYCGVPPTEIKWGDGRSNLAKRVDARVLKWIDSTTAASRR